MSPWLLVPGALAVGIGLVLVFASVMQDLYRPRSVAPTVRLDRLRHRGPCNHRRGPNRPGRHGQGLPADSEVGSRGRFWAILAPFTPDDDLFGRFWPERGRSLTVPVELTHSYRWGAGSARRSWACFDQIREAFARDDASETQAYWREPIPKLAEWCTIDL